MHRNKISPHLINVAATHCENKTWKIETNCLLNRTIVFAASQYRNVGIFTTLAKKHATWQHYAKTKMD